MSASYDYFNLPDADDYVNLPSVPEELQTDALRIVKKALSDEDGTGVVVEAKFVHLFDRKGYLDTEAFGNLKVNTSYRTPGEDDVLVQVTMRLRHSDKGSETYKQIEALDANIREINKEQARIALQAEIVAQQARAARAAERIAQRQAELDALD